MVILNYFSYGFKIYTQKSLLNITYRNVVKVCYIFYSYTLYRIWLMILGFFGGTYISLKLYHVEKFGSYFQTFCLYLSIWPRPKSCLNAESVKTENWLDFS
jgi:hypothetical protein